MELLYVNWETTICSIFDHLHMLRTLTQTVRLMSVLDSMGWLPEVRPYSRHM